MLLTRVLYVPHEIVVKNGFKTILWAFKLLRSVWGITPMLISYDRNS